MLQPPKRPIKVRGAVRPKWPFWLLPLLCLLGCQAAPSDGYYYKSGALLEIAVVSAKRVSFQLAYRTHSDTHYLSGKADKTSYGNYVYTDRGEHLIFSFSDHSVLLSTFGTQQSRARKYEGTYFHLKRDRVPSVQPYLFNAAHRRGASR